MDYRIKKDVERLKSEANTAKEKLMRISNELWELKDFRDAKSLMTIIEKLEIWQNK